MSEHRKARFKFLYWMICIYIDMNCLLFVYVAVPFLFNKLLFIKKKKKSNTDR